MKIICSPKTFDALRKAGLLVREQCAGQVYWGQDTGDGKGSVRCKLVDGESITFVPPRYVRRYTNDLRAIRESDDLAAVKGPSDYKVHVLDRLNGAIVWQNCQSERYGTVGLD